MLGPQISSSSARSFSLGRGLLAVFALALLAPGCRPPAARPAARRPPALPARIAELSCARPAGAPSEAQIVSFARRSVLVSFVAGRGGKPIARYVAVDATGRPLWLREHACPVAGRPLALLPAGDVVLCKTERALSAIAVADGELRWTFAGRGALRFVGTAGDRVLASDEGKLLTVLDAAHGRPLRRFALGSALVAAAGATSAGPMAFLIEVAGDKARALLGQPVGGAAASDPPAGAPLAPAWRAPYGGVFAELMFSGDVVIARPDTEAVVGFDAASGAVRWRGRNSGLPRVVVGPTQLAASGVIGGGVPFVASLASGSLVARWQQRWPFDEVPSLMSEANGHTAYATAREWRVYRAADGLPVADGRFDGIAVLGVAGDHALLLGDLEGAREVQIVSYGELPAVRPLPEPEAAPDWLLPGTRLVYSMVPGDGGQPRQLEVHVRARAPELVFDWRVDDGRRGRRSVPAAALASAEQHADEPRPAAAPTASSALCVSQAALRGLQQGQPVAFRDAGAAGSVLQPLGSTFHRVIREAWDHAAPLDLRAVAAKLGDEPGYAIATFVEAPLLLRAQRRDHALSLERIVLPRPGTRPDESALRWPPRCAGRTPASCLAAARQREREGAVDAAFLLAALAEARTAATNDSIVWGRARELRNALRDDAFLRVDELVPLLERACRRDREACLARIALHGAHEARQAKEALDALCKKGERRACLELAELLVQGRGSVAAEPARAAPLLDELCGRGNLLGCMVLGGLYAVGSGVTKDPPRALQIWGRVCEQKLQLGCVALGSAYAQGIGTAPDIKRSLEVLGRACDAGEAQACLLAGIVLYGGKLVARDAKQAAAWFTKGCDGGDAQSCLMLADQHANGDGVSLDAQRAEALVTRACDAGDRRACLRLRALNVARTAR